MRISSSKRQNGFTLLGVLISAFVIVIVISALASLLAQSYSMARVSKNRFIAINLAKEGVELVRNMRDGNWLYYPDPTGYNTTLLWRGEATDDRTICGGKHCPRLRSICNGDFIIDAAGQDLLLQPKTNDNEKLNISGGVYTHGSGDSTPFKRTINITSTAGDCGEQVNSAASSPTAPQPLTITSTVTWKEPGTAADKSVVLKEMFSDWILSRGTPPTPSASPTTP